MVYDVKHTFSTIRLITMQKFSIRKIAFKISEN